MNSGEEVLLGTRSTVSRYIHDSNAQCNDENPTHSSHIIFDLIMPTWEPIKADPVV